MDSSHVSLVGLKLDKDSFQSYRCDRTITLGLNLVNLGKILKCAGKNDSVTLRAGDDGDTITFVFENEGASPAQVAPPTRAAP